MIDSGILASSDNQLFFSKGFIKKASTFVVPLIVSAIVTAVVHDSSDSPFAAALALVLTFCMSLYAMFEMVQPCRDIRQDAALPAVFQV